MSKHFDILMATLFDIVAILEDINEKLPEPKKTVKKVKK